MKIILLFTCVTLNVFFANAVQAQDVLHATTGSLITVQNGATLYVGGGYALYVNCSIWANGTTNASNERFKQNITAINSPLQKLLLLNGVEYEMRVNEFAKQFCTNEANGFAGAKRRKNSARSSE